MVSLQWKISCYDVLSANVPSLSLCLSDCLLESLSTSSSSSDLPRLRCLRYTGGLRLLVSVTVRPVEVLHHQVIHLLLLLGFLLARCAVTYRLLLIIRWLFRSPLNTAGAAV